MDSPECLFSGTKRDAHLGKCAHVLTDRVNDQPSKKPNENGDSGAVAILKDCVSQDMEPPKCSSILRKSAKILMPIRRVQFTKATLRHADIRDKGPSLGTICQGDLH